MNWLTNVCNSAYQQALIKQKQLNFFRASHPPKFTPTLHNNLPPIMLNNPVSLAANHSPLLNDNINSSSLKSSKPKQISNQPNNFLYDVILPNTLNIENIRIIKKHQQSSSPQTIQKKVLSIKKCKLQTQIQAIIKNNAQLESTDIEPSPKLKKYTKQTVKKHSKFEQEDHYKQYLFEQKFSVDAMKLNKYHDSFTQSKDKENNGQVGESKLAMSNPKQRWDSENQPKQSPFLIEMDQKLDQLTKMQQESFQPFKEKVMKVMDKTVKAGKNTTVNALLQKVNFYITSIAENHSKQKYRRISVDAHKRNKQIQSYCEQVEKGMLAKRMTSPKQKSLVKNNVISGRNQSQAKQFRSMSSGFLKTRPHTAAMSSRTASSTKVGWMSTNATSLSTSRLNRYTPSSAESNIKSKPSGVQGQKQKFAYLLEDIENACWSSKVNTEILGKRLNKMSQEWNIDEEGFRVYENKRMDMNEDTLEMIKRLRKKAEHIQKVEQSLMEDD